jgi:hypothetical protein
MMPFVVLSKESEWRDFNTKALSLWREGQVAWVFLLVRTIRNGGQPEAQFTSHYTFTIYLFEGEPKIRTGMAELRPSGPNEHQLKWMLSVLDLQKGVTCIANCHI